eukprot:4553027-Amphidinium_carterae.2
MPLVVAELRELSNSSAFSQCALHRGSNEVGCSELVNGVRVTITSLAASPPLVRAVIVLSKPSASSTHNDVTGASNIAFTSKNWLPKQELLNAGCS